MLSSMVFRLISWFSRMSTALVLLAVVGIACVFGTLIPQGQAASFYYHNYGQIGGRLIQILSLDNLYYSGWFVGVGALLGLSLISCVGTRWRRSGFQGFPPGSLLIHLGLAVLLIAASWSLLGSRSTQVNLIPWETVSLKQLGLGQGQITLQDFIIDYYPDGSPQQYRSRLLWSDQAVPSREQTISVNHPMKVGGTKIYQASYGWRCLFRLIGTGIDSEVWAEEGSELSWESETLSAQLPRTIVYFVPDYNEADGSLVSRSPHPRNPRVILVLHDELNPHRMEILAPGQTLALGVYQLEFKQAVGYSGLRIKQDHGLPLVYLSFILLLIGLIQYYLLPMRSSGLTGSQPEKNANTD